MNKKNLENWENLSYSEKRQIILDGVFPCLDETELKENGEIVLHSNFDLVFWADEPRVQQSYGDNLYTENGKSVFYITLFKQGEALFFQLRTEKEREEWNSLSDGEKDWMYEEWLDKVVDFKLEDIDRAVEEEKRDL